MQNIRWRQIDSLVKRRDPNASRVDDSDVRRVDVCVAGVGGRENVEGSPDRTKLTDRPEKEVELTQRLPPREKPTCAGRCVVRRIDADRQGRRLLSDPAEPAAASPPRGSLR